MMYLLKNKRFVTFFITSFFLSSPLFATGGYLAKQVLVTAIGTNMNKDWPVTITDNFFIHVTAHPDFDPNFPASGPCVNKDISFKGSQSTPENIQAAFHMLTFAMVKKRKINIWTFDPAVTCDVASTIDIGKDVL